MNHRLDKRRNGNLGLSAKYRNWIEAQSVAVKAEGHRPIDGACTLSLVLVPPDNHKRDEDNYVKPVKDVLEHGGLVRNDNQIVWTAAAVTAKGPNHGAYVMVEELDQTPAQWRAMALQRHTASGEPPPGVAKWEEMGRRGVERYVRAVAAVDRQFVALAALAYLERDGQPVPTSAVRHTLARMGMTVIPSHNLRVLSLGHHPLTKVARTSGHGKGLRKFYRTTTIGRVLADSMAAKGGAVCEAGGEAG